MSSHKDAETLRRLYHDERMTQDEVADELGVSTTTIRRWMKRLGVESRTTNRALHTPLRTGDGGYEKFQSYENGRHVTVRHHRLLACLDHAPGDVFDGEHHVHHENGLRWDNRPGNIELHSERGHVVEHGGFSWLDRLGIHEMVRTTGRCQKDIASAVGVSESTMSKVLNFGYADDPNTDADAEDE